MAALTAIAQRPLVSLNGDRDLGQPLMSVTRWLSAEVIAKASGDGQRYPLTPVSAWLVEQLFPGGFKGSFRCWCLWPRLHEQPSTASPCATVSLNSFHEDFPPATSSLSLDMSSSEPSFAETERNQLAVRPSPRVDVQQHRAMAPQAAPAPAGASLAPEARAGLGELQVRSSMSVPLLKRAMQRMLPVCLPRGFRCRWGLHTSFGWQHLDV